LRIITCGRVSPKRIGVNEIPKIPGGLPLEKETKMEKKVKRG
jgi:hypothetical protein